MKKNRIIFPDSHFEMKSYDKYFDKKSFIKEYILKKANEFTINVFNQQNDLKDKENDNIQKENLNSQNSNINNNYNKNIIPYGNPYLIDINENDNSNKNINK